MTRTLKLVIVRILNFVTNHVIALMPSFALRRAWYRWVGLPMGAGSGIHRGCYLWFIGPGHLRRSQSSIGQFSRINRGCCIDVRGRLNIGDNVSVSPEVAILTMQHDWRQPGFALQDAPVTIEDHVWIGFRAIVMPGTRIGRGSVIAAGSVARGDIPPLSVVAGVPGRVIGTRPEAALDYQLTGGFPMFE